MRKLKLQVEALRVETFEVTRDRRAPGGTVYGRNDTGAVQCGPQHTDTTQEGGIIGWTDPSCNRCGGVEVSIPAEGCSYDGVGGC